MAKAQFPTFLIGSRFAFPCRGLPAPFWHGCMSVGGYKGWGDPGNPTWGGREVSEQRKASCEEEDLARAWALF